MNKFLMIFQIPERSQHTLVQVQQVLANLRLALLGRILEFHATQLVQNAAHVISNRRPGDLVFGLRRRLDRATSCVVESD